MFDLNSESWHDSWARLVARAWSDESFKEHLVSDPRAALEASGMALPADLPVLVREGTSGSQLSAKRLELGLPRQPPQLLEENLSPAENQETWQMVVCLC